MSTINSNGTMAFGNALGGSVTIIPKNDTATNYTIDIPDVSGTMALTSDLKEIGVGQTWQDMTASRVVGTTYTNSTGKPIMVSVKTYVALNNVAYSLDMYVNGIMIYQHEASVAVGAAMFLSGTMLVPNGATYKVGESSFATWFELR